MEGFMRSLFEYSDMLNAPIEAFRMGSSSEFFPVESHWHYFIEILYIEKGSATVTCNEDTFLLHTGEMIFLPPQAVHSICSSSDTPLQYVVLKFSSSRISFPDSYLPRIGKIFWNTHKDLQLPLTFSQKDFTDFSLKDFFNSCVREMDAKRYGYDSFLRTFITQLTIELLRIWREHGFTQESGEPESEKDFSIHDVLMYIDSHSHENIQISKLAEMCHMSYSYFAKTFHKLYGQSCQEYIEFIRLSKVENYLLFTNYDLNYISSETGFSDCSHLIRVFKRKYHVTPKQYRLQHSQKKKPLA